MQKYFVSLHCELFSSHFTPKVPIKLCNMAPNTDRTDGRTDGRAGRRTGGRAGGPVAVAMAVLLAGLFVGSGATGPALRED